MSDLGPGRQRLHEVIFEADTPAGKAFDVVLLDYYMPGTNGVEVLRELGHRGIDAQLATKESRKGEMVPRLDEDLIELYEELRGTKDGVGVGALIDGMCGGCHLKLTAAEVLDAKRTDPSRCIHCRRILVI